MNCVKCKTETLKCIEIDQGLKAYHCSSCEGHWIRANDYVEYTMKNEEDSEFDHVGVEYDMTYESKKVAFCPDCGSFLIKYQVANDIPFNIDHCGHCHGIWLDKNEWSILQQNNLHKSLNKIFTQPWQKALRDEMTKANFEKHYTQVFGNEGYKHLREIREWLYKSEHKDELLAYIVDDDPYKL